MTVNGFQNFLSFFYDFAFVKNTNIPRFFFFFHFGILKMYPIFVSVYLQTGLQCKYNEIQFIGRDTRPYTDDSSQL